MSGYNRFSGWRQNNPPPTSIVITGDVQGSVPVVPGQASVATLSLSPAPGQPAGIYGASASPPILSFDEFGRNTNSSSQGAARAWGLTTAVTFSYTGDATGGPTSFDGTANVSTAMTLATVNSNVGTFGSATQNVQLTVNAKGLVTAAANVASLAKVTTVSGLGAATAGGYAHVTDSTATLAAGIGNVVAGGGSNYTPVYADGTNWRIG